MKNTKNGENYRICVDRTLKKRYDKFVYSF